MIDRVEHWIEISNEIRKSTTVEAAEASCNGAASNSLVNGKGSEDVSSAVHASEEVSSQEVQSEESSHRPDFPLLPASKGFCITVKKYLTAFKEALDNHILTSDSGSV